MASGLDLGSLHGYVVTLVLQSSQTLCDKLVLRPAGEHSALLSNLGHGCPVVCPAPYSQLGLVLKTCKLLAFFLHNLYFWPYISILNSLHL